MRSHRGLYATFRRRVIAAAASFIVSATSILVLVTPASANPPAGYLGALDATSLGSYCVHVGYPNGAFLLSASTGANAAYDNWACDFDGEGYSPITPVGSSPSMTDACVILYGGSPYAYPSDADDANTWGCYLPVITSSANPSNLGDDVTLTATMVSAAQQTDGEDVDTYFVADDSPFYAVLTDGVASAIVTALPAGHNTITVYISYTLPGGNSGETSTTYDQVVNTPLISTTTALASSANPSVVGQAVTFTATVSAGGGTVNFLEGVNVLGSGTLAAGLATFSTSALSAGAHTLTAVYLGDATHSGSPSAPLTQTVNPPNTTTTTCTPSQPCASAVTIPGVASVSVTAQSSTTGTLTASLGASNISCGDPFRHAPKMSTITDQGLTVTSDKMVVVTIPKGVVFAHGAKWWVPYAVCYNSPTPFKSITGRTVTTGLLPACGDNDDRWNSRWLKHRAAPCVSSIKFDSAGNLRETLRLPAADPKLW